MSNRTGRQIYKFPVSLVWKCAIYFESKKKRVSLLYYEIFISTRSIKYSLNIAEGCIRGVTAIPRTYIHPPAPVFGRQFTSRMRNIREIFELIFSLLNPPSDLYSNRVNEGGGEGLDDKSRRCRRL